MKKKMLFCLVMACALAVAGNVYAQFNPDYYTTVTDSEDPVAPDTVVNFEITVGNQGNAPGLNPVILDIYMPMDVPVNWQTYLDSDEDARTAIVDAFFESANILIDDNIWNEDVSGIYVGDSFNNACESMIIQPQDLVLTNGDSGVVTYDAALPASNGISGLAWQAPGGDVMVMNYGTGGCNSELFDDCAGIPCMGPRLTMTPTTGAPVEVIDDGDGVLNDGCQPFQMANPGYVALIDRGSCNFSDKAKNASDGGASGFLIANTGALGTVTPTADSIMSMGCTDASCHSLITLIPGGFISYNDGEAIKTAMASGPVTVFAGVRPADVEYKQTKSYVWESAETATDTDDSNDRYTETTTLGGGVQPVECTPVYVAAAAAFPNNTPPWASDLGINNTGDADLTYKFKFLPRGEDNTDVAYTEEMTLAANAAANFVDVWNTYAGEGAGSIEVCVNAPEAASVVSRIYTTTDEGTLGQSFVGMAGMTPAKLIGMGDVARLGFLTQNADFRTNVGFMNAGATAITVMAEFFGADGVSLGTSSIDLPPYSNNQWNRAFRQVTNDNVDLGYIDVWSETADAMFLTYGSVIDNMSDDPTTIWPYDNMQMVGGEGFDCTPIWVAAAASFPNNNPVWASDLGITNLGSDELTYKFQFLPRGIDGTTATMSDPFTLGGNQSIAYTDVWNMSGGQGAGAINVCVDNADNAGVASRIYSIGDMGTYGQGFVGMRGSAPAKVATGEKVRLAYLFQNDAYRTNIGFMNAGANQIQVMAEFFDMDGTSLGTKAIDLLAYSNNQWNNAFTLDPINASDITAGYVDVWTETADSNFLTYASIVDNGTGDPTTIWPF